MLIALSIIALYLTLFTFVLDPATYRQVLQERLLHETAFVNYAMYVLALVAALLVPGSALMLVLAAVPIFGAAVAFGLSVFGGFLASLISYGVGTFFGRRPFIAERQVFVEARRFVHAHHEHAFLLAFLSRALPNPLYDAWGVAFGLAGVRAHVYLAGALCGGSLTVGLLCLIAQGS